MLEQGGDRGNSESTEPGESLPLMEERPASHCP